MSEDQMMDWKKATVTNPDGSSYSVENEPKGHPNAAILMEIAKEASINPEYWKEFEFEEDIIGWTSSASEWMLFRVIFEEDYNIRRKPRTIRIGNYDVPEFYEAFSHVLDENAVVIRFESEDSAGLMLKALKELVGKQ